MMNSFQGQSGPQIAPPQQPPANAFQGAPQQQAPQQGPPPNPEDIANGHKAVDATMDGLIKLVSLPKGDLTKKEVFDGVSEMIARGAFPTPESKQKLIGGLANLPDDEQGIRKLLGQMLLGVATFRNHMHNAFGPPQEAANPLQQEPVGSTPMAGAQQ